MEENPQLRLYDIDQVMRKRSKIITVDDNLFVNLSVKAIIEKVLKDINIDYEVLCASDGIDILQYIREDQMNGNLIKCIITDENMEFLNGSNAVKIIREFEKMGRIKPVNIISSTCHEDEITKNIILESGSQIILSKPLNALDVYKAFLELSII